MFKAGFGKVDITPASGCGLQGYFNERSSTGVHDPLFVKAAAFSDGGRTVSLAACDLLGTEPDMVGEARGLIQREYGIPPEHVLVCGTHSHTAPNVVVRRSHVELPHDAGWRAGLPRRIAAAVGQAVGAMAETKMACGSGHEEQVSFNRRFVMKSGRVQTNPGVGNPDIVKAAGPIDPELGVVAFGAGYDRVSGLLANFALHLDTVGGERMSADFPSVIEKTARAALGDVGFVYTSGAMGNLNHIDVRRDPKRPYAYFEHAERIGRILGGEVVKTVSRMGAFGEPAGVAGLRRRVALPLREWDATALGRAHELLSRPLEGSGLHHGEFLAARALLKCERIGGVTVDAELTGLAVGEVAFIGVPCEYFVEFGLEIKKASPFAHTFIVELAGDYLGYVAPADAYGKGDYEATGSIFKPGAGETLRNEALGLLRELRRAA